MATIPLYDVEGKEIGALPLPDSIFGVTFNEALVHQAVTTEEANQRQGTHDTLTRSEVRGGGRKPWRQKGTGRARQGTIRAPHWRHGGVVFGPHPRDYRKDLPVKMRRGAMRSVLSVKVAEGSMLALDALEFDTPKTKKAIAIIKALNLEETRRILIIIPKYDQVLLKSTRNIPNVELRYAPNFSVRDALVAHKIILVKGALHEIERYWLPEESLSSAVDKPNETVEVETVAVPSDAPSLTHEEVTA